MVNLPWHNNNNDQPRKKRRKESRRNLPPIPHTPITKEELTYQRLLLLDKQESRRHEIAMLVFYSFFGVIVLSVAILGLGAYIGLEADLLKWFIALIMQAVIQLATAVTFFYFGQASQK